MVVGFVDRRTTFSTPRRSSQGGECHRIYHKMYLPNYGVFDEFRYFQAGRSMHGIQDWRRNNRGQHLRRYLVSGRPVFHQALPAAPR